MRALSFNFGIICTCAMGTIFQAPQYDPAREKRRRNLIITVAVILAVLAGLYWMFRFWPQERRVDQFFTALEQKDYEKAYGIYMHDPDWKQHQDQYARYPFHDFYVDWGPGGDWGLIRSHKIDGARKSGNGVVVQVTVNDRKVPAKMWVDDKDKTLTVFPF